MKNNKPMKLTGKIREHKDGLYIQLYFYCDCQRKRRENPPLISLGESAVNLFPLPVTFYITQLSYYYLSTPYLYSLDSILWLKMN